MPELAPDSLDWKGVRFLDPVGRVFEHEGEIYRAIYPGAAEHVRSLFDRGIIDRLVERRLLVTTTIASIRVPGFEMVLHHRRLPFITRPSQWPRSLLRDAASLVVELNLELAEYGLGTIDFHPMNIQQVEACHPIWIDFGSIQPTNGSPATSGVDATSFSNRVLRLARAIRGRAARGTLRRDVAEHVFLRRAGIAAVPVEFRRSYLYPLALLAADADWARPVRLLLDGGGISDAEYRLLGGKSKWVRRGRDHRSWLESMREWLSKLELRSLRTTWGGYYGSDQFPTTAGAESDPRSEIVARLVADQKPERVIDLGCNAGGFTALVLRTTPEAQVYAVDSDEEAVESLYRGVTTWDRDASVTVALGDVLALSVEPAPVRGELVLALALSHHLFLSQHCRFPVIAKLLAEFTTDALLTEFMPNGLGRTTPHPAPLPHDYTLEAFTASLESRFREVEVIRWPAPEGTSPRVFIHARGKR